MRYLIVAFVLISCTLSAQENLIFSGKIFDKESKDPLIYAHIGLKGTNLGTITNQDGEYTLNIPKIDKEGQLVISYLGYKSKEVKFDNLKSTIYLEPIQMTLSDIYVRPKDISDLILEYYHKRNDNYYFEPINQLAFYRETIQENGVFFEYAEGLLKLYKKRGKSYQIELLKGRRSRDIEQLKSKNTSNITIGGPGNCLTRDIINYKWDFLHPDFIHLYDYEICGITTKNDKAVYIIDFDKKPNAKDGLYKGKIYLEPESNTIVKITFEYNDFGLKKEQVGAVIKGMMKAFGSEIIVGNTRVEVNYERQGAKWTLNNIDYEFELNYNKRKNNYKYLTQKNLVILSLETTNAQEIPEEKQLKSNAEFGDNIEEYDELFWSNYNILKPTQEQVKKLKQIN